MQASGRLKQVGSFTRHLVIAVFGVIPLELPLLRLFNVRSISQMILRDALLSIVFAFCLGLISQRYSGDCCSRWVWLGGFLWLVVGVTEVWSSASVLHKQYLLVELLGFGSALDFDSYVVWSAYTLPFLRTVFYSLGSLARTSLARCTRSGCNLCIT